MKQETLKGRGTETLVGTSWAGWGLERAFTYQMPCVTSSWSGVAGPGFMISHNGAFPPPAVQTASVLLAELDEHPVFRRNPSSMFTNTIPVAVRNEILTKGIPAISPSAGIVAFGFPPGTIGTRNLDMNIDFKPAGGAWGRIHEDYGKRWLHNDMKDMAFFYTHLLFEGPNGAITHGHVPHESISGLETRCDWRKTAACQPAASVTLAAGWRNPESRP